MILEEHCDCSILLAVELTDYFKTLPMREYYYPK